MTVLRNDKVVLVKEYGELRLVGTEFEVANVTETAVVLRDIVSKVAIGAIDIVDFEKYFTKKLKGWTDWTVIKDTDNCVFGYYRTNNKKVQFKLVDGFRSEATCYKDDTFNLATGINIAFCRCYLKMLNKTRNELLEKLDKINFKYGTYYSKIKALSE